MHPSFATTVAAQLVKVVCRNGADLGWALGRVAFGGTISVAPTFSCVVAFFVDITFCCGVNWKCNSDVCRFPSWGAFGVPAMGELDPVEPLAELTGDDDEEVGGASLDRTGLLVLLAPRTLILGSFGGEETSFLSLRRMKSSSDVCRFRTSTASAFWVFAFPAIFCGKRSLPTFKVVRETIYTWYYICVSNGSCGNHYGLD